MVVCIVVLIMVHPSLKPLRPVLGHSFHPCENHGSNPVVAHSKGVMLVDFSFLLKAFLFGRKVQSIVYSTIYSKYIVSI